MSTINEDANTPAHCEVHGEVGGDFAVSVTDGSEYTTGKICPKCYVDWVRANVRAVKSAPLKFVPGTLITEAEPGTVERVAPK